MQKKAKTRVIAAAALCAALAMLLPASCDNFYEELDPCPVNLRLVYDYNMEYANAFPSKVDNFILYIYDEQGNFLKSYSEAGEKLSDENYRLQFVLPDGKYRFVAYGGMEGENRSFGPVVTPAAGKKLSDLQVLMRQQNMTSDKLLYDFFYGAMDVTVEGFMRHDVTLHLMCNTNSVRILLQHLDGSPIPVEKFKFSITDDNTLFDNGNNLIPNGTVTYLPWAKGIAGSSRAGGDEAEVQAGFAEFSTSRLWRENHNRLTILRAEDNDTILSIPLNEYLLLMKSEQYKSGKYPEMGAQEFLDREHDWSVILFLDSRYKWINTVIIVNGWTVRLNDTDL